MRNRLFLAAGICSLGGLIFGYDLGALSAAIQSIREYFNLSAGSLGLTVSLSLWGTIVGSLAAGPLADGIGRQRLIAGCSLVYALAAVNLATPLADHWHFLMGLRFTSGIAIGGFTVGCPLYLAEVAPKAVRGRLVGLFQLQVCVGVAMGFGAGAMFAARLPPTLYWKWCFLLGGAPAILLFLLLPYMPEVPRFLAARGEWNKACSSANLLALSCPDSQLIGRSQKSPAGPQVRPERLFSRKYARPILLATSVALFNQLSGANVLLVYLLDVLFSAGLGSLSGHNAAVLITSLNIGSTILGMMWVDKLGRKPLLAAGSAGMSLCLFALAFSIPHHIAPVGYLVMLVAFNAFFALSQGTVIWVYLSELFPVAVRGAGQGYGSSVLWIATAALIWIFPAVQHGSSMRSLYFFGLMMILQILVVLLWYPETKGTALGLANSKQPNLPREM